MTEYMIAFVDPSVTCARVDFVREWIDICA